jgi:protein-tyrosine phosphatase
MRIISDLFAKKEPDHSEQVLVDIHSHLLPGLDDGSQSMEESLEMIEAFAALGYRKLITTPHIMGDFYRNTPEIIREKLAELRDQIRIKGINIDIDAAAEYYLDESFLKALEGNKKMLTFGENYLLFETSYLNEPAFLAQTVFAIKANGYWPVLAHPERYQYLYTDFKKVEKIHELGISFQLNINSISGYYSRTAELFAAKLIKNEMVHFVGSDCHSMKHIEALKKSRTHKDYRKLLSLPLLNNSLLG